MTFYARIKHFFSTLGAYVSGGIELLRMKRMINKHDANYNNGNYRRPRK